MKSFWLVVVVALLFVPAGWGQEKKIYSGPKEKLHIYILAGQSNMSGRAKVEDEDRKVPQNLFLLDKAGKWVEASHPFIQYTNVPNGADDRVIKAAGKSGLNFGLTFARRMLATNPEAAIGLVVNSQGGSAIESWKKGAKASNYDKTLERVRAVRNSGLIKGVLWHQGEANMTLADKYPAALAQVIEQFRKDLDSPNLPFIVGQIAPLPKQKDKIEPFNMGLLKLPMLVPNTGVVRADDLSGADIHFNSADTRTLGLRYAEEMLKVQKASGQ